LAKKYIYLYYYIINMKFFIIYYIDYKKNDQAIIKELYYTKEDAVRSIERTAVEYIKELQGKQQSDICKQNKTLDEIFADNNLKEGMYIKKFGDYVEIYEKMSILSPGRVWNSYDLKVIKAGKFDITEHNFDDVLFKSTCTCSIPIKKIIKPRIHVEDAKATFIDELRDKQANGKIKLRPVKTKVFDSNIINIQNNGTNILTDELKSGQILDIVMDTNTNITVNKYSSIPKFVL